MEGLIPFIYRAITKERRRRSYSYSRCSSAGSALGARAVHDHVDDVWEPALNKEAADDGKFHAERATTAAHRRHRSMEELAGEVGASPTWRPGTALSRGRSVRIFSCISGM